MKAFEPALLTVMMCLDQQLGALVYELYGLTAHRDRDCRGELAPQSPFYKSV
jgi:hypothetical protein